MMPAMMLSLVFGQEGSVGLSARVSSWIVGSGAGAQRLERGQLGAERVGRHARRGLRKRLDARAQGLDRVIELGMKLLGAVVDHRLAEDVGEVLGGLGRGALGRDSDQVALRDRVGLHVRQQRTGAALGVELGGGLACDVDRGDEAGGRLHVASRVVGFADQPQAVEVLVVGGHRGDQQVRLGLIGLVGRPDVERRGQRRHQRGEDDQLGALADRLDVAAQTPLLLGGS